jgi:preprotein translocase subunit SecG
MLLSVINGFHLTICIVLTLLILVQQSRGGGLGGALGGSATQVFGGRGSANFMTRLTSVLAALFMITSMSLAYLSSAGDREMKAFDQVQADR